MIDDHNVKILMKGSKDKKVSDMAMDPKIVKSVVKVLNTSLEIAKEMPSSGGKLSLAVAKKAHSISDLAGKTSHSQNLDALNFAAGQTLKSLGLLKVANYTPAKAGVVITLTMAEKIVSAAGLGNFDKCKLAVTSLAITTGLSVVGATTGIGTVIGALAIAADAYNVYGQCYAKDN